MWSIVTFGMLCAACIAVSSCVKVNRNAVVIAAMVITTNWFLFSMPWIYAPASLAFIVSGWGMYMTHEETWSAVDLFSLVAVGVACRHLWWSPILWSTYLVTLSMHAVAWANGLEYLEYRRVLDAAIILQLATLFVVGGGDCADRVFDCWRSFRGVRSDTRRMVKVAS